MSCVRTRSVTALAIAVLATALLAGCGSDSTGTSTSSRTHSEANDGGSPPKQSSNGSHGGGSGKQGSDRSKARPGGGSSAAVSTPLKISGGGSAQFRVKGGDNSIQNWGTESGDSELRAAAEAVHGFFVARAEEDWATACTFLASSVVSQFRKLVARSELKGKGCAPALEALTRPLPAAQRRKTTIVDAGSLRIGKKHSFLIYYGEGHTAYGMPLEDDGGAWKLTLLAGNPLG